MFRKKRGFSIIEMMIVLATFSILLGAIFWVFAGSERGFRSGGIIQQEQQEARKVLDRLVWDLRPSNPEWTVEGSSYPIQINAAGDAISFYLPIFDDSGQITSLSEVSYYSAGVDNHQLRRREGMGSATVISAYIDSDPVGKPFFQFASADHARIDLSIPIKKSSSSGFRLSTQVVLRNQPEDLGSIPVEEVEGEGEF